MPESGVNWIGTCSGESFGTDTVYPSQCQPKYGPFGGVLANCVRWIHCTRSIDCLDGIHLATIARYVEVMAGVGSDSDESDDKPEELLSGDEEVSRGLKKVAVNTWLDDDWYLKQK